MGDLGVIESSTLLEDGRAPTVAVLVVAVAGELPFHGLLHDRACRASAGDATGLVGKVRVREVRPDERRAVWMGVLRGLQRPSGEQVRPGIKVDLEVVKAAVDVLVRTDDRHGGDADSLPSTLLQDEGER